MQRALDWGCRKEMESIDRRCRGLRDWAFGWSARGGKNEVTGRSRVFGSTTHLEVLLEMPTKAKRRVTYFASLDIYAPSRLRHFFHENERGGGAASSALKHIDR